MPLMMQLLRDLGPLNRVICSSDYDRTIEYLQKTLQFRVIECSRSDEFNGWVIPPKWDVKEAKIVRNGTTIYDGTRHPLAVIALSRSFSGTVSRDELKKHLHFDHRYPEALTFHFRQQFRSWDRDWGFCVPRKLYDALRPGDYDVVIITEESPGILRILESTHPGTLGQTIVIGANLDHPGVVNDGLSGCAVAIDVFQRLCERQTRYTYKVVLLPGIIGSEYYLGKMPPAQRALILEGLFLEMLGTTTQLALQQSRHSPSDIEMALAHALQLSGTSHRMGPFESILINDEYIWEAYGVPTASLSRFPYPEYHCSRDDCSIITEESLRQAADIVLDALLFLDASPLVMKKFEGTICLSNPAYDLYVDPGQVALGDIPTPERRQMRLLMDTIPTLTRPTTVRVIARRLGLPEESVLAYLRKWQEKGLLDLR